MLFLKTSEGALSDAAVRRALVLATDKQSIKDALADDLRLVHQPFLTSQNGYAAEFDQPQYNPTAAITALEQAGWVSQNGGIRHKNNQPLNIIIVAEETPENQLILRKVKEQWRGVGVDVQAALQQPTDFQSSVETHTYTALLYTISIGPDPDVYAYWSSTQADPRSSNRLNFSEYKSAVADTALEGGRTRQDPIVRALKYKPFLKAWQEDAPAIALYQPKILYITRGLVHGLDEHSINTDADRYYSVTNWAVKIGQIAK
jgi:peptide/nickel transport system substrate-binding protein